jgi:hypothetical protein
VIILLPFVGIFTRFSGRRGTWGRSTKERGHGQFGCTPRRW